MTIRRDFLRATAGAGAGAAFGIVPAVARTLEVIHAGGDGESWLEDSAYLFERN